MARLVGIGVLLWSVFASLSYSIANLPQPAGALATGHMVDSGEVAMPAANPVRAGTVSTGSVSAGTASSGLAMATGGVEDPPTAAGDFVAVDRPRPTATPGFVPGIYEVGDSPNPRVAAADKDISPNRPLLEENERLDSVLGPNYVATIQGEIIPGLYATEPGTEQCSYQLWRVMKNIRRAWVIGEDYLESGRLLVTIDGIEPDWFTSTMTCARWHEWSPRSDRAAPAANGDYGYGDLATGAWSVPEGCLWEKVVAFRGASLRDVVDSGHGPAPLKIDDAPVGVRVRGCSEPITLGFEPLSFP